MKLFNRIFKDLQERKQRIESGEINCIPFGLPKFETELPGIEKARYYLVTANSKIGKTQITNYLFLYRPIFYAIEHPDQLRLKIFYFSLEISIEEFYQQFICHLLYVLSRSKIRIEPKDLKSTSKEKPLSEDILKLMQTEEYQRYFKFFEEHVVVYENVRNPYGIYKILKEYAVNNGTQHKKIQTFVNNDTKETYEGEVDDYYVPNDDKEYVIAITDSINLLTAEKGGNIKQAIDKFSSEYCIPLRNKYGITIVNIQQQAAAQEGLDAYKLNKIKPSLDGLGDSKLPGRDANYVIGLYSPFRYEIQNYLGYDITYWRDNIRFMEIIASRHGGNGTIVALFFDGAVNFFSELPKPGEASLDRFKELVERVKINKIIMLLIKNKKYK